jgi:hypothetical protein
MKRVAKAFTLFIASGTYVWLLFMTATTIAAFFTLRDSATIKQWLDDSGVYSNIVDEVSKLATIQQKQESSLVQITSEDIQSTAQQVFTPDTLQSDMENVVDGFYGWFRGETTGPEFSVDFSGRQAAFASAMTLKLEQKINALPECTNTGRFTIQAFDPFKAECRPKNIDLTEELASFEKELAESKDILPQISYSGDDVVIHEGTEKVRLASAWPWVPQAFKGLLFGPWVVALLTLIAGLTLIFMSTTRRKGARRFASGLLFTGVILILSGFFLRPAFERLNGWSTQSLGGQASFTQNIIDPIFREMNETYSRYSVYFGIGYTIPALITYGVLLITRPKKSTGEEATHESAEEHASHPSEPVATPAIVDQPREAVQTVREEPVPMAPPESQPPVVQVEQSPPTPATQRTGRVVTRRPPMIQG